MTLRFAALTLVLLSSTSTVAWADGSDLPQVGVKDDASEGGCKGARLAASAEWTALSDEMLAVSSQTLAQAEAGRDVTATAKVDAALTELEAAKQKGALTPEDHVALRETRQELVELRSSIQVSQVGVQLAANVLADAKLAAACAQELQDPGPVPDCAAPMTVFETNERVVAARRHLAEVRVTCGS